MYRKAKVLADTSARTKNIPAITCINRNGKLSTDINDMKKSWMMHIEEL